MLVIGLCLAVPLMGRAQADPPLVSGVSAAQRPPGDAHPKYVDIQYTLSDPNYTSVNVFLLVSTDSGATWDQVFARTFVAGSAIGTNVSVTTTPTAKTIIWDAGTDWPGHYTANCRVRVLANNVGLVLVPPGSYSRGDANLDSDITDAPIHSVYVSAFYMDQNEVTGALWDSVKGYADANGYTFLRPGTFKAANHPVQSIDWFEAVKWCNARSQREGLTPVYYSDAGFTTVYKTGEEVPYWKPGANGYRLPTEAEWEKAARGAQILKRFPWGDTIRNGSSASGGQANYNSSAFPSYDLGPFGHNSAYNDGVQPYTSPVASFGANGYYLHDMVGNIREWCWDWYGNGYYAPGQTDPQGPSFGIYRVVRGGSWDEPAVFARSAFRFGYSLPMFPYNTIGFRSVRGF